MLRYPTLAPLVGAALLALPLCALSQSDRWHRDWNDRYQWGDPRAEKRLVGKYERFAGSDDNARSLVKGLRSDTRVELSQGSKSASFRPRTDQMGYGNVDIALGLAKASLLERGIRNPTPDQIEAALNGGTVMTRSGERVRLSGVLKLRASGLGWGQVAHKLGFELGDVMRAHKDRKHDHKHAERKHDHKHAHNNHKRHDRHWKHERKHNSSEWKHARAHDGRHDFHRTRLERPGRPHKIDRPERSERPHRPERPERHGHRR